MNRLILLGVILLALPLLPPVAQAQDTGDEVVSMVEAVALAAGRLLPAAIHSGDLTASQGISLAVGTISHDGVTPRIAGLLQSITEEELLQAADSFRGRIPLAVVDSPAGADLVVQIRSASGPRTVLFSIQFVDSAGRILAASRVTRPLSGSVRDALGGAPQAGGSVGGGDDPPESPEEAWAIDVNSRQSGLRLQGDGDSDWFTFTYTGDAGITAADGGPDDSNDSSDSGRTVPGITVFTTGDTDTYIEVYGPDSSSTLITENDDGEDMNASASFPVAEGGQFWIKVRGFSTSTTGTYDLHVQSVVLELDAHEPNDSMQSATPLAEARFPMTASIRPRGDRDWYHLSEEFLRELLAPSGAGNPDTGDSDTHPGRSERAAVAYTTGHLDTVISLYNADGQELAYNDDGGEGTNARLVIPADLSEAYLEVRGFGSTEGDYSFTVETVRIEHDEYEPDGTAENASLLEWNDSPQRRTFSSESDVDWVRLEVPPGDRRQVVVETFGDVDTYMTLYDENRGEIAYSDDDGYGMNARIDQQLAGGTYFVEIRPLYLSEPGGEYALEGRLR
jgi:hypothetical protein